MSKNCNKNNAPRNGTNRLNRLPQALDASFVAIDERSKEALYQFVERLSAYINYYYYNGAENKTTWQTVFNLNEIRNDGLTEPHLALFDAFLDLYAIAQKDLNQFTAKHLDYFFETVLGFEKKPASPDKVYLTVELAKHISQYILNDSTEFKAGKNSNKKEQFYKLLSDFSFSNAQVGSIKSILVDSVEKSIIARSPITNSGDGIGGDFVNQDKSWDAFGDIKREKAKIGFAIASPLFRMAEGKRKITLNIQLVAGYKTAPSVSSANFKALVSAEKGWEEIAIQSAAFINTNTLQLVLFADETNQKIIDYDLKLHLEDFRATYPVVKIELIPTSGLYNSLMFAPISSVKINTDVREVKNLLVQNSLGKLDASKPMEPFGSIPTIGANFYIGSSEVFQHELKTLNLSFEFLNLPGMAFNNYYKSYAEPAKLYEFLPLVMMQTIALASSSAKIGTTTDDADVKTLADTTPISKIKSDTTTKDSSVAQMLSVIPKYWEKDEIKTLFSNYVNNSSFKAEVSYLDHRSWIPLPPAAPQKVSLFGTSDAAAPVALFKSNLSVPTTLKSNYNTNAGDGYDLNSERGFLKLKFTDGKFGHADYQLAYSRDVLNNVKEDLSTIELPNAPYTPLIQNLSLSYTCETTIQLTPTVDSKNIYDNRVHQFYVSAPFGQAEVHPFKNKGVVYLLPNFVNEGELYIGLVDVVVPQQLSLLFQVSEGSANPDFDKAILSWAYLQNNNWYDFKNIEILREQTNGLLTTGIVTLNIPKTVNADNTLLPTGFVWLRISAQKDVLSICDIISITAQAAEAEFSIYEDVVPESIAIEARVISKLKNPDAAVKKVAQPYGSFDGKPAENGNEYYLRVSERLRHKGRSITLWDYERLILAQFPNIYTAKCISHTSYNGNVGTYNSLSPGAVTIIAVPDISISNAPNPLKPMVSKNTLEEIKGFINKKNSAFAQLNVQNPIYEEIKLHFHVKLKDGYEENIYLPMLKERIRGLLAPWTNNNAVQLEFGGKIEKSTLIYQLEKLSYVDYITCFKMFLIRPAGLEDISTRDLERAETATAASILTSFPEHSILNINDIAGIENPDCACVDCEDNIIKSTKQFVPVNECGCN
ncbi:hypothetical protein EZ449_08610 [Pedobacter frigidisoli]|uniref:Baseplate J-like protein n=1 Tax=Pedobacter frigidisoli TaxID=2530455 RepID=A0A4R0P516_9SPHI|nr:hypothetical protein [Pedobacter frigidisoli]TCD10403.1 hypothetical protein EZ449_08610 [Pedobacter frigidisoli]